MNAPRYLKLNAINCWLAIISILRDKMAGHLAIPRRIKFMFLSDPRSDLEKLIRKVIEAISAYF